MRSCSPWLVLKNSSCLPFLLEQQSLTPNMLCKNSLLLAMPGGKKNLDTIGLIAYSATPQVSAKHSCHLFFWEGIGIYNHLVIVYSL